MYVMEDCYCPECKRKHQHPVNYNERPRVHIHAGVDRRTVYLVWCHRCTTSGLSVESKAQYDAIFNRIVEKCQAAAGTVKTKKRKS